MKKRFVSVIVIVLCCLLTLPMTAYARNYSLGGTDISINVDDTRWYVFTRENIKDNSELSDLGIAYSDMYDILHNNKMYMDAILLYDDGEYIELFVRKTSIEKIVNLSNYDDDDVLSLAEKLAEKYNAKKYSVYKSQYKFMKLEYSDLGFYICEYATVVNGENYTLTFQATEPFTNYEYNEIEEIVDSVRFTIDQSMKEDKGSSLFDGLLEKFISGAVIAAIVGGFSLLFGRKKRKEEDGMNDNNSKPKKKKDRRGIKRTFAVILFVFQALGLFGYVINGEFTDLFTNGIAFLVGSFSYSIIAVILLISAHKETKRIEEEELLEAPQRQQPPITQTVRPVQSVAPAKPVSKGNDKAGNYDYIKVFFGVDDISGAKKQMEQQIVLTIDRHNLTRKTDLMKVVFADISRQFEERPNANVNMLIASYYQIAFDTIMVQNNDMNDFIFTYAMSKMSETVNTDIHKYLQMLVKIQLLLDNAIVFCSTHKANKGEYAHNLQIQIFNELNAYIDDASDWNKIVRAQQ